MSTQRSSRTWSPQTQLLHAGRDEDSTGAVSLPIYQTSTYQLESPERGAELAAEIAPARFYTRYGSPNVKEVEAIVRAQEGAPAALALGSGMAAVAAALLSNLRQGDHVVAQRCHYTATLSLLRDVLPRFGVEVTCVSGPDMEEFRQAMRRNTRLVFTETPTNPILELTNLEATAELAHARGALAVTDNTFASSFNQRPLELGYDIVVHSGTKYFGGHEDVTAGLLLGSVEAVERAWEHSRIHGPLLHPFEAWLLARGLRTYSLRMAVHNSNGMHVAQFLAAHPAVSAVHYPGLAAHPQHELARKQMTGGFGGVVSFELAGGQPAAFDLLARLELCIPAASLGGVHTLILHPGTQLFRHNSAPHLVDAGIPDGLVRLSVGIESAADIEADLEQALD